MGPNTGRLSQARLPFVLIIDVLGAFITYLAMFIFSFAYIFPLLVLAVVKAIASDDEGWRRTFSCQCHKLLHHNGSYVILGTDMARQVDNR